MVLEGIGGRGTHKFLASPGERAVAEVAGFLKHRHLHPKVQAATFRFQRLPPDGCTSVLCFLGLCCIGGDEVLHLGFLVSWGPGLLIETALAPAT